ncbi:MAG: hypothetical protein ACLVJB_10120, partial [Christensenellales bacterium]
PEGCSFHYRLRNRIGSGARRPKAARTQIQFIPFSLIPQILPISSLFFAKRRKRNKFNGI